MMVWKNALLNVGTRIGRCDARRSATPGECPRQLPRRSASRAAGFNRKGSLPRRNGFELALNPDRAALIIVRIGDNRLVLKSRLTTATTEAHAAEPDEPARYTRNS